MCVLTVRRTPPAHSVQFSVNDFLRLAHPHVAQMVPLHSKMRVKDVYKRCVRTAL